MGVRGAAVPCTPGLLFRWSIGPVSSEWGLTSDAAVLNPDHAGFGLYALIDAPCTRHHLGGGAMPIDRQVAIGGQPHTAKRVHLHFDSAKVGFTFCGDFQCVSNPSGGGEDGNIRQATGARRSVLTG